MLETLSNYPNLTLAEGSVEDLSLVTNLITSKPSIQGVILGLFFQLF